MATRWYYGREAAKLGPYSAGEMKDLASTGQISPEDTVWREGVEKGVPAKRVKNLFAQGPVLAPAKAAPALADEGPPTTVPPTPLPDRQAPPPQQPEAARKGRASAGRGAVIVGQDGVNVKVRKKCTTCGHLDSSWLTMPIRAGTTKVNFFCPKCRKTREVEVIGSLN